MQLRGFDSYEVTLGDLMRGERASMGKSLIDAERDMRIKANLIDAIENCDLSAFKNHGVISGYVRSYARYLGMDQDAAYQRFCVESGFRPPSLELTNPAGSGKRADRKARRKAEAAPGAFSSHALTQSRFAVPPAPSRLSAAISLSGLASTAILIALVAGLGYGGYALLQEIQRVGFAPLPEAPVVVAEAPLIVTPDYAADRPDASVYQADGALAALSLPSDLPLPAMPSRDGPISAIDPETSGIFAPPPEPEPELDIPGDAIEAGALDLETLQEADRLVVASTTASNGVPKVEVVARGEAWIRVRDASNAVIFEGILRKGARYALPPTVVGGMLRAGNAGDVYLSVNGQTYGPVGKAGSVVGAVSLAVEDVRAKWPVVETVAPASDGTETLSTASGN